MAIQRVKKKKPSDINYDEGQVLIGHKCHGEEAWEEKSGSQKQGRKRSGKQIEDVTKKEDQTRRRRKEEERQGAEGRGGEDNMVVCL